MRLKEIQIIKIQLPVCSVNYKMPIANRTIIIIII